MKKTIGGNRVGSGKKMKVDLKSYERSTHDLSHAWRSTMSAGTLVPFYARPILPGSTFDIEASINIDTHPTIGPLFGSYKAQIDFYICPMRLYIARLHNNESGLGMDMKNVYIPQIEVEAEYLNKKAPKGDNNQINPSSVLGHLGIRGLGRGTQEGQILKRQFNGIPYLAYHEIYKNYYANQQEEFGAVLDTRGTIENISATYTNEDESVVFTKDFPSGARITKTNGSSLQWIFDTDDETAVNEEAIMGKLSPGEEGTMRPLHLYFNTVEKESTMEDTIQVTMSDPIIAGSGTQIWYGWDYIQNESEFPQIKTFPLANIDRMKRQILQHEYESPMIIDGESITPYNYSLQLGNTITNQQGLLLKTYQNDLFNNYMNSEWIDGENGINQITAVQIIDDKLEIPSLILARKVFNVLNRIALSGGTYDDWLEVTYDHERVSRYESPAYMGGLIQELVFEEVVSTTATETENGGEQPLGTLAGRGRMSPKKKGGNIVIKTDEPAYIIGIVSLTPRIDYSQGNEWDVNLKTFDDLHKPELDAIGFQDLITDQMAWFDTECDTNGNVNFKSAGKQPAWINYQTAVNRTRGNFAVPIQEGETDGGQMWMTLNRQYEYSNSGIQDLTSYIDPEKFNNIFAYARRDAQNFWVQIGLSITARQKMSAKVMPNL